MSKHCSECGAELAEGMEFCSSCGARTSEPSMEQAGVGARFGSYIIDSIIVDVPAVVISIALDAPDALLVLSTLISVPYYTYFFGNGQTPGMKMAKIKLCGTDGTYPIGYGKGLIRFIGMIISALVVWLGYLWILIDKNKQGWHDKIADTYVVLE